ncbi:hypothetical protein [Acaryochloris sp. IP29b_bin.148]|uniref:hypothetical protein n=1 Tax=Acaryochloris sp. IP29b_bin.148 TaxID=2969218 RepID=UPI0026128749|nr:hypothetical protein [Acaryochloris sp. IP29b_bin.148]
MSELLTELSDQQQEIIAGGLFVLPENAEDTNDVYETPNDDGFAGSGSFQSYFEQMSKELPYGHLL